MNGPKILLVISDKTSRPAFSSTFKSLGCQVFTTISAENALAALEGFQPDVILADMAIEDMKSSDFLRKIRENLKFHRTPIVSYTRLLTYKLTNPDLLPKNQSVTESEDSTRALEVLRENIGLVPGEIVLWVAEALTKQNAQLPVLLNVAVAILRNSKV